MITRGFAIVAALLVLGAGAEPDGTTETEFTRQVVNLEYERHDLSTAPPPQLLSGPEGVEAERLLHGVVPRRLPGETSKRHFVPFAVRYESGVPTAAWCDTNLNGDLSDDPTAKLSA